ncbi:MAG: hypothetical protein JWQ38_186 [Flavipsychrobacter sp.]|nr:hypothetical protein [Flavipsychrobacter sp.]
MVQIMDINWFLPLRANLELLNNAIYSITDRVQQLDTSLASLNKSLNTLTNNKLNLTAISGKYANVITSHEDTTETEPIRADKNHGNKKKYTEVAISLGELAESNLNLVNAFRKLSPAMEEVKGDVEFLNGGLKAVSGMEAFSTAGGLIESLIGAGAIIAGAEAIISAATVMNPIVLGTGAVILGGVAAAEHGKYFSKKPDVLKNNFSDEAQQKGNQYSLKAKSNDILASQYVELKNRPKEKSVSQVTKEVEILKKSFLRQGGTISFDHQKTAGNDPIYLQALVEALNYNDSSKRRPITNVEFEKPEDLLTFRNQFDKFSHFPLNLIPYVNDTLRLSNENNMRGADAWSNSTSLVPVDKEKARKQPSSTGSILKPIHDIALTAIIQSYLSNGLPYVQKEYQNYVSQFPATKNQANIVWKEFQGIKGLIDNEQIDITTWQNAASNNQIGRNHRSTLAATEPTRPGVTINLNRPMIGNFTINTRDMKEGMTDFKHKVEEVLLEILNSANVI